MMRSALNQSGFAYGTLGLGCLIMLICLSGSSHRRAAYTSDPLSVRKSAWLSVEFQFILILQMFYFNSQVELMIGDPDKQLPPLMCDMGG